MARRKKGNPVSGWVVIDKPAGWGSTQIVGKVRWAFNAQKAGHAGTLDPAATGVLAVALGEATKTIPFITDALKAYRFTVRWGAVTSSDDAEGEVLERFETPPERGAIEAALPDFCGDIMQVPPRVSAVKVDGARAYDLARDDEEFELKARPLFVERLTLVEQPDAETAVFEMVCGKGGYVRSIARDLGQVLGCGGHVLTLRRVWSGPFDATQGIGPEEIEAMARTPELQARLLPVEAALQGIPEARLTAEGAVRILNGNPGAVSSTNADYGETAWGSANGSALAIGTYMGGMLHPTRVLNQSAPE